MATTVTFTGSDGDLEGSFTGFDTSGAGFRIASNQGRDDNGTSFQGYHTAIGSIGPGDVDLRVQITTLPSGGSAGYVALYLDIQNSDRNGAPIGADQSVLFCRYHESVGGVQLGHYKSGTSDFTVYDTNTSWSWANGHYLRLTREGNVLKSWASSDGSSWTELSSQTITIWTDQTGRVGAGINHTSPRIDNWTLEDSGGTDVTIDMETTTIVASATAAVTAPPRPRPDWPFAEVTVRM